ncbi:MAG: biotin carboxyl carrier protein [Chloroflexi bacterium]|nr:biotin carboxyl carrier protein [Chloroflexota bacterium]
MNDNEVRFVDQTLRDGPQSLWAMRMSTPMMLAIAPVMDEVGYESVSLISGGMVSTCLYYFRENPFERARLVTKAMPNTPTSFGIRYPAIGQFNVVPESVRELWIRCWAGAGARSTGLNEFLGNYKEMSGLAEFSRRLGLKLGIPLVFAITPVHTDEWYTRKAAEIAQSLKPDNIWIKDSMGLLTPERTRTLVPAVLKGIGSIPLGFHSHCNTGLAPLCYLEAVRLGARAVHTCVPPLANGISVASALNMERNLSLLGYKPMVNRKALEAVSAHFMYAAKREGKPIGAPVEYDVSQAGRGMAGGVISNLKYYLEQRGLQDRWEEVVDDIQVMCKEWGYPPNVTPYSQIMSVQAVLNVSVGERYAVAPDETIRYLLGHFGKPPAPIDQNVLDKISSLPQGKRYLNWEQPQPSIEDLRKEMGKPGISDEELMLRLLYPGQHVDAGLSAGSIKDNYPRGDKPLLALITEMARKKDASFINVEKNGLSLTLRKLCGKAG